MFKVQCIKREVKFIQDTKTNLKTDYLVLTMIRYENGMPTSDTKDLWVNQLKPREDIKEAVNVKLGAFYQIELNWNGKVSSIKEVK